MAIYGYNYYNQVIDGRTPRKLTVPNQPDHWISVGLPPGNSSNTDAETACSPQKNEPHTLKMYGVSKKEPDLMVFLESNIPSVGCKNPHVCCLRCPNFPHLGQLDKSSGSVWKSGYIPKISPKYPQNDHVDLKKIPGPASDDMLRTDRDTAPMEAAAASLMETFRASAGHGKRKIGKNLLETYRENSWMIMVNI